MRNPGFNKGSILKINNSYEGDDLVTKLRMRMETNNDMETTSRPLLYNERKDGVPIEGNPRTDKWEVMQDALEYAAISRAEWRTKHDKTMEKLEENKKAAERKAKKDAETAVTQGTDGKP